MALKIGSVCINHTGVEAVGRCKQCGKPFCNACKVMGPTGLFCSDDCKVKHENFVKKAAEYDHKKGGIGLGHTIGKLIKYAVVLAILVAVATAAGTVFKVPVLSDFAAKVRDITGL
ncbi:MAG: hypothetical protein AMXMBFR84_10160 [Candidatus Hydrogenedentota bacterium]